MHEDALSGAGVHVITQLQGGKPRDGRYSGDVEAHPLRDRHTLLRRHTDLLGQRARRLGKRIQPGDDPVAGAHCADLCADAQHFAGELGADAARRTTLGKQPELSLDQFPVERVDADKACAHGDLVSAGLRLRHLLDAQDFVDWAECRIT